jgi:hypothetical protein
MTIFQGKPRMTARTPRSLPAAADFGTTIATASPNLPDTPALPQTDDLSTSVGETKRRDAVDPPFVKAKFQSLVLVCGQCEKRSSGPSKLTAKDARKTIKGALGGQRARMRIVQCSCLGLCPKKSIAIAAAGEDMPALLAGARNERDLREIAVRLGGSRTRD